MKLFGIRVEDPAVKTVIVRSKGSSGDRLVIGPGGIRLAEGKNLQLRTNVQLAGRQSWNIPGGSAVEIKPSPVQEKAMPVRLSGQAEVHVTQAEGGGETAEGGGETAEAARVVLEQVLPSALKCSWTLSGKVEMTLKGMEGKAVNLGKVFVKQGAVLNLNGSRPVAGSVVNQGGTVNP